MEDGEDVKTAYCTMFISADSAENQPLEKEVNFGRIWVSSAHCCEIKRLPTQLLPSFLPDV